MDFVVQVVNSVREVNEGIWDHCGGGDPFAGHRWYRFGEAARTGDKPVHILLFIDGEPIARAAFWVSWQEPLPISSGPLRNLLERFLRKWPILICRAPVIDASGLVLPQDPALRKSALQTIARAAQEVASQYQVSYILFPFLRPGEAQESAWPADFCAVNLPGPSTCLQILWPNFESYLKQLPRSTRTYYRHNRNRAAERDIQVEREMQPASPEHALHLIRNVEKHHRSPANPWVPATIKNAGMVDATWFAAKSGGQTVGSLLTFKEQESGLLSLIGLDYAVPNAYFLLLYEAIRSAIESQTKILWGGSGAYPFKQSLGFELTEDTWAVFASRHKTLQKMGRFVARRVN